MFKRLTTVTALVVLATTAYAADSSTSNTATTGTTSQQSNQSLPQEITTKLQQDGFTDVKVVPGSFLVSAKDKRGDPVTMLIGPHSMLVMTEGQVGAHEGMNTGSANQSTQK